MFSFFCCGVSSVSLTFSFFFFSFNANSGGVGFDFGFGGKKNWFLERLFLFCFLTLSVLLTVSSETSTISKGIS